MFCQVQVTFYLCSRQTRRLCVQYCALHSIVCSANATCSAVPIVQSNGCSACTCSGLGEIAGHAIATQFHIEGELGKVHVSYEEIRTISSTFIKWGFGEMGLITVHAWFRFHFPKFNRSVQSYNDLCRLHEGKYVQPRHAARAWWTSGPRLRWHTASAVSMQRSRVNNIHTLYACGISRLFFDLRTTRILPKSTCFTQSRQDRLTRS